MFGNRPHVLDHMYAKKPREPGSEQIPAKPRRRAKRKEQVVEQFIISDANPPAPKINIIRYLQILANCLMVIIITIT